MMAVLMKGHTWQDHKHKMSYPAWAEIKSDEIRCHVVVHNLRQGKNPEDWQVSFTSYAGKPLHNLAGFETQFSNLAKETGYTEFDCGIEVNRNYNDSYRLVRSSKGTPKDLVGADITFWLFDLPELEGMSFEKRVGVRANVSTIAVVDGLELRFPVGDWVHSAEAVEALFTKRRSQGFEGLMVKSMQHLYERGKRSYGWLKVKPSADADGVITALHEAICGIDQPELNLKVGDRLGRIGSVDVSVLDDTGKVVGNAAPHGIPHELGVDMLKHPEKYLNQWCEFSFMERDRQGGYRHPTFTRLREEKA